MLTEQATEWCSRYPDGMPGQGDFEEPIVDDALLEATLIHLRLLDDFLGPTRKDRRDIHASDWVAGWTAHAWLPSDIWRRVSAQVAHLSRHRDPQFDWDIRAYSHACCGALDRFLRQVRNHNAPRYPALAASHERVREGLRMLAPQE